MPGTAPLAPLGRIVDRLAATIGVLVALAVPITFGLSSYVDQVDKIRVAAELSANRIAQYAFIQGETWRFSTHRVAELISGLAATTGAPRQVVLGPGHELIVDIGDEPAAPRLTGRWPIVVQGEEVGAVVAEASLIPLLWRLGFLMLLGAALGGSAYLFVHFIPLRALRQVSAELERTQAELAASHARLSEAVDALPDGFALYDAQDRLVMFNHRFREIYGLPADAPLIGTSFEETLRLGIAHGRYITTEHREAWIRERVQQHRTFNGAVEQELRDGRWLRIAERSTAAGGRVGISTDITELKQSEAARIALREQFHRAQKMQALGALAGGVAHDFNNLLAIIIGQAELLAATAPGDTRRQATAKEILQAAERGVGLVKQILAYSRHEPQAAAATRLDTVIEEELGLLRASLPSTIELTHRTVAHAIVLGNRTQLHQILMNLCVNASRAIGSRPGRIDIELDAVDVRPGQPAAGRLLTADPSGVTGPIVTEPDGVTLTTSLGRLTAGPHWRLAVRDDGIGMNAAVLGRIFEPFFTTREVGTGTGLGLAAVSGIVASMRGGILVHSAPGRGSKFELYLPAASGGEAAAAPAPASADMAAQSRRILFVDDEPGLVSIAVEQFKAAGFAIEGVTDPLTALRRVREAPLSWDLVVTDHTMPRMTGIDLVREMLALRPGLPIIMCTGYSEAIDDEGVRALGIRELLVKPVRGEALMAAVRRAVV